MIICQLIYIPFVCIIIMHIISIFEIYPNDIMIITFSMCHFQDTSQFKPDTKNLFITLLFIYSNNKRTHSIFPIE